MSSSPTLGSLQSQLNALQARVTSLDGQGLTSPQKGFTTTMAASVTGCQQDVVNNALALEAMINNLAAEVTNLQAAVNALISLTGITYNPPVATPP